MKAKYIKIIEQLHCYEVVGVNLGHHTDFPKEKLMRNQTKWKVENKAEIMSKTQQDTANANRPEARERERERKSCVHPQGLGVGTTSTACLPAQQSMAGWRRSQSTHTHVATWAVRILLRTTALL